MYFSMLGVLGHGYVQHIGDAGGDEHTLLYYMYMILTDQSSRLLLPLLTVRLLHQNLDSLIMSHGNSNDDNKPICSIESEPGMVMKLKAQRRRMINLGGKQMIIPKKRDPGFLIFDSTSVKLKGV